MLVYYFVPFIVSNRYLLFWVSNGHNSVTVQDRTHVYMNFFDHKNLGNHLLQLCPKVVKHPVYIYIYIFIYIRISWRFMCRNEKFSVEISMSFMLLYVWGRVSQWDTNYELWRYLPRITVVASHICVRVRVCYRCHESRVRVPRDAWYWARYPPEWGLADDD